MLSIILTGHGGFASGMEKAMKQILGEQSQLSPSIFRKPQAPRCLHRSLKRPSPNWIVKTALFF